MADRWGKSGNGDRLYVLGLQIITEDGDLNHEIKRHLLLGRKVMRQHIKSRDITLLT